MLEELENTAKLIKQNADLVESKSLDKLNSLYAEKRRARKHYQEEHNRIVAQFTHVSTCYTMLLIICSGVLPECVIRFCFVTYVFSPSYISDINYIFEQLCKLCQIVSGFDIGM
jgi:tyrosine-protein kinase Fer